MKKIDESSLCCKNVFRKNIDLDENNFSRVKAKIEKFRNGVTFV